MIAWVNASGLGLPDRDYYVKSEPRFIEARDKYLVHVAAMFELAGYDETAAKRRRATVMAFETRARRRPRSTTSRCAIRRRPITR